MIESFVDTFYFVAMLNPKDAHHLRVTAFNAQLRRPLVTTAWVLVEVANTLAQPPNRELVVRLIRHLAESSSIVVIPPTQELFEAAFRLYEERPDKDWSLTDCTSFVVMQRRGITDALTGDRHFEQAGFKALLR